MVHYHPTIPTWKSEENPWKPPCNTLEAGGEKRDEEFPASGRLTEAVGTVSLRGDVQLWPKQYQL